MQFDLSKVKPYPEQQQQQPEATSNFDLSKVKPFPGDNPQQGQQQKDEPNAFMSAIAGFNNGIEKLTVGTMQGIGQILGAKTPGLDSYLAQSTRKMQEASAAHPTATMIGGIAADIGKVAPLAMLGGTSVAGLVGSGAAGGAALGLAENPGEGGDRTDNALVGGALGAVGGAIGAGVMGVAKAVPALMRKAGDVLEGTTAAGAESQAAKFAAEGGLPHAAGAEQAAQNLGTFVSGAETLPSKSLQNMVGSQVNVNPERVAEVAGKLSARENTLQNTLTDVVNQVNPGTVKETKAAASKLYEELKPKQLSTEAINDLMGAPKGDTYVSSLYAQAHAKGARDFDKVVPGSWEDLQITKSFINDKIKSAQVALTGAAGKGESSGSAGGIVKDLIKAKEKITKAMDTVDPHGFRAQADMLTKKAGFETKITKELDKINLNKAGQEGPMSGQFYSKLLSNKGKQDAFLGKVKELGGDAAHKQAKDLITVLNTIQNSPLSKYVGRNPFADSVKNKAANIGGSPTLFSAAGSVLKNVLTKKNDDRWFKLMLDPKFSETTAKLSKQAEKIQKLTNKKASKEAGKKTAEFVKSVGLLMGEEL